LRAVDPDEAVQCVQQVKGIGPFAAELVVVRGANAPDALPRHERQLDAEKTEDWSRTVPLPDFCPNALKEHAERQADERDEAGDERRDHGVERCHVPRKTAKLVMSFIQVARFSPGCRAGRTRCGAHPRAGRCGSTRRVLSRGR